MAESHVIEASRRDHVVHFYWHEDELVDRIGRYVRRALAADAAAIVVATASHRHGVESWLTSHGIDIEAACAAGLLHLVDARETLARFFVDGVTDASRFREVMGELIRSGAARGRALYIYGEMVAVLWQGGHVSATMALESLWNDLSREHDFSLLCGYPAEAMDANPGGETPAELGGLHSALICTPRPLFGPAASGSGVVSAGEDADDVADRSRIFPARPDSPRVARHWVTEVLKEWGVVGKPRDDAALVISELASNALLPARSDCMVTVSLMRDVIYIAVKDQAATLPTLRPPIGLESSGRGLSMVFAVSRRRGADLVDEGKVVWAELRPVRKTSGKPGS